MEAQCDSLSEGASAFLVQGVAHPPNSSGNVSLPAHPGRVTSGSHPAASRAQVPTQDCSNTAPPCAGSSSGPAKKARAVEVVCGPVKGVFLIDEQAVLLKDKNSRTIRVSPTEMERLGGKESNKKWKSTLKVLDSKGQAGKPVGEWLRLQGIDLGMQRKPRPKRNRSSLTPAPVRHVNLSKDGSQESTQKSNEATTRMAMGLHLKTCRVGCRPGDPESAEPPSGFPEIKTRLGLQEVNMMHLSNDQLLHLSQATEHPGYETVAETLLPNPPGVLVGHEAYLTGREPKRKQVPKDQAERTSFIGNYLSSKLGSPPWEAFATDRLPKLGNKDVDLRELYSLVQASGGFDRVNNSRKWPGVADKMGLNSGLTLSMGYGLRSVYKRFLLKFEKQEQALYKNEASGNDMSSSIGTSSKDSKEDSQTQGYSSRDDTVDNPQSSLPCSSFSSQEGFVSEDNTL